MFLFETLRPGQCFLEPNVTLDVSLVLGAPST